MSLGKLMRSTCVIEREGQVIGYDEMGDPEYGPSTFVSVKCHLAAVKASEEREGGLIAVEELRLYLPATVTPVPDASEHVKVNGLAYSLQGNALPVRNARSGKVSHLLAAVRRVT